MLKDVTTLDNTTFIYTITYSKSDFTLKVLNLYHINLSVNVENFPKNKV